jgi:predicted kinase
MKTQKTLYVLVGVPGSGKSTWIKNQDWAKDIPVVSTDKFIDEYAAQQGKTYNEVFTERMPVAVKLMANQVEICKANNTDIIWDQTSTTVGARGKKLRMCPNYYKIAVVFKTPDDVELQRRLASRPGKNIPKHVQEVMASQLRNEPPTLEEGFDEIWSAE